MKLRLAVKRKRRHFFVEQLEDRRMLATNELAVIAGEGEVGATPPEPPISSIDLKMLGSLGVSILGSREEERSGYSVSQAGDVNGDGFDDVIIGSYRNFHVVFGSATPTENLELKNLVTGGITILDAQRAKTVTDAGDINGDGYDDLIVGIGPGTVSGDRGTCYVIYGGSSLPATLELYALGKFGTTFRNSRTNIGSSISRAGDINADGYDDIIIAGSGEGGSINGTQPYAEGYLVFGGPQLPEIFDLITLEYLYPQSGRIIRSEQPNESFRMKVNDIGDFNGDGIDDLVLGVHIQREANFGKSYILFGGKYLPPVINLADPAFRGVKINGNLTSGFFGEFVSGAGDINGDGFDDVVISGFKSPDNSSYGFGTSLVIFGSAQPSSTIEIGSLGENGISIKGKTRFGKLGLRVSAAGDVNGDGFDDLILGDGYAREAYVVFGASVPAKTIELGSLGGYGFSISNFEPRFGFVIPHPFVSGAGDFNGDGFDDLIVSYSRAGVVRTGYPYFGGLDYSGKSNVVFGGNKFNVSVPGAIAGDPTDNLLDGTSAANVINGARGNDVLDGKGGADVLIGGQGDDVLSIGSLDFERIDGGNGRDTLRLGGVDLSLDLTEIPDNRILGIEQIDLIGNGTSTLSLDQQAVFNLSDKTNVLVVRGDTEDRIALDGLWTTGPVETMGTESYQVFTLGSAQLKVSRAVSVKQTTTTIDLITLGSAGTTIYGADRGDQAGDSVSDAGDVNGDGFDDFIIGARFADGFSNARVDSGEAYLIFGGESVPATIDLDTLRSRGVKIYGAEAGDQSGFRTSGAGDINGDGFDDIIVGAFHADSINNSRPDAGESYILFGKASWPETIDLAALGSAGVVIYGESSKDYSGASVSTAGDVNGDGIDDLLIGAFGASGSEGSVTFAGRSYLIYGRKEWSASIELSALGNLGVTIRGAEKYDASGNAVSGAGDVNGDGFDDLIISAFNAHITGTPKPKAGEGYLIFGGRSLPATIDISALGSSGIKIIGVDEDDQLGRSVSSAGDVNADGYDDFIISAMHADAVGNGKSLAGESYLVFGSQSLPSIIDLALLGTSSGVRGTTFVGAEALDGSGVFVSDAGDINGDGFDDLVIGAFFASTPGNLRPKAGESYVVFGRSAFPVTMDLGALGSEGVTIYGVDPNDVSGASVSVAGDLNGDGFDDLLIGAYYGGRGSFREKAGEAYVVFGGNRFTSSVTHLGSTAAESLVGTSSSDVIVGDRGDDILIGNGGTDSIVGGAGDDVLAISDLNFKRIVGGNGIDTLRLDGKGLSLDLPRIADNRLVGIEEVDLTGDGANSLSISPLELLNLSNQSNSLIVRGNTDDDVILIGGWTLADPPVEVIDGANYRVLKSSLATVKIGDFWNYNYGLRPSDDEFNVPTNWILNSWDVMGTGNNLPGDNGLFANDNDMGGLAINGVVVEPPTMGTLQFSNNGTFKYRPSNDAISGQVETFRYQAKNAMGESASLTTVTIRFVDRINSPRQNPNSRFDVNKDDQLSPLDALQIINALRRYGTGVEIHDLVDKPEGFFDVDGDFVLAPLDVLQVINQMKRRVVETGEGETTRGGLVHDTEERVAEGVFYFSSQHENENKRSFVGQLVPEFTSQNRQDESDIPFLPVNGKVFGKLNESSLPSIQHSRDLNFDTEEEKRFSLHATAMENLFWPTT